jgi:hypothetical protein
MRLDDANEWTLILFDGRTRLALGDPSLRQHRENQNYGQRAEDTKNGDDPDQ